MTDALDGRRDEDGLPGFTFRGITLRRIEEGDMPFLFRLFADPQRSHLWSRNRTVHDEREFQEAWIGWTRDTMGAKFLVERSGQPLGLVFEHGRSLEDGHTRVSALLEEGATGHGAGVIATVLLQRWLFRNLPLRKIYHDVYAYNEAVVRMHRKLGFVEEAVLRGDRYWNGRYWDLHMFALYKDAWPRVHDRILRLSRRVAAEGRTLGALVPLNGSGNRPDRKEF